MTKPLTFLMGKHPAVLPADRQYFRNHMWIRDKDAGTQQLGFSAYAVRLMQDVYFLEWSVDVGAAVAAKAAIGFIETSKAQSELYAPFAGTIAAFNANLLNDPTAINTDGYGEGWLLEMTGSPGETLNAAEYHSFLSEAWVTAQRIIKGQINSIEDEAE